MAAKVGWTPRAFAQLDEAATYMQANSPAAAERLVIEALEVADTLAEFPERGRVVPDLNDRHCRELFVANHRLVYRIEPNGITVVGFVHSARDFRPWWRRQQLNNPPN